jgi:hypothetical protein
MTSSEHITSSATKDFPDICKPLEPSFVREKSYVLLLRNILPSLRKVILIVFVSSNEKHYSGISVDIRSSSLLSGKNERKIH